ncbi:DUF2141 domain-containing protein [Simiduia sp. 21SJ11W-1]|uniref:DUF2141 domain-containing protein n=1 Tax=Simiduia sp. 21SJ11W-1 TaxID=2909669 RepID=UPI00209DCA34|nr:DUF2141 domain-containing protein [Simiduia sp. 21SJ11W-1]UTA48743.1 DUF2141 domain-containing protein [Simiduia sp. 21SJ11W-1]
MFVAATLYTPFARAELALEFVGVTAGKGQVMVSIWGSKDTYFKQAAWRAVYPVPPVLALDGRFSITITEPLPPELAVSVFYDANANNTLDTHWFGLPAEAVGSSNNVQGRFGPPAFKDAKVAYSGAPQSLVIHLNKLLSD